MLSNTVKNMMIQNGSDYTYTSDKIINSLQQSSNLRNEYGSSQVQTVVHTVQRNWEPVISYLMEQGIFIIFTLLAFYLLNKIIEIQFKKTNLIEQKRKETIESLIKNASGYLAFFIIAISLINPFVDIKKMLVAGGVLGIVIGFGAQSLIKDVLTGFFLIFERQFQKGDFIHFNENADGGTVEEVGLRIVKIRLVNGKLVTIPNGEIRKVINGNVEIRRVMESVVVSYREDPKKIVQILEEVCDKLNEVHKDKLKMIETIDENDNLVVKHQETETDLFAELFCFYGMSSLDTTPHGYRYTISATVEDIHYLEVSRSAKLMIAQTFYDKGIRMGETNVRYRTII